MCKRIGSLLVVSVVKGTICDAHIGLQIVSVAVLSVAIQKSKGGSEVSLLQKVARIWQL